MSYSEDIAKNPAFTEALAQWADPTWCATPQELRTAIGDLDLVPPVFLTQAFVGRVLRLAGVPVRRTSKGILYLGLRVPEQDRR